MGVDGEEVGVLRVDVGALHHVLVLVGCGDVLGLVVVGVGFLAVNVKVIETVARNKRLACCRMTLLNWAIGNGADSLISFIAN